MGEIKSTLDLVLEKTKNLTLSSKEKEEQKQKELENRIKGMMQKYQDGILSKNQLITDYEMLKKDYNMSQNNALITEVTQRIEPEQNNQPLLEVLQECCTLDTAAIETITENFRKAYLTASQNRMERLKEDLAQQYNITGSAVLPNLDADEQWRREAREMRGGYEDQLNRVKDSLLGGKILNETTHSRSRKQNERCTSNVQHRTSNMGDASLYRF